MTRARIEEYLRVAEERRVDAICITEHLFRFEEAYTALYGWWDADPDERLRGMVAHYWKDHVSGPVADYVRVVEEAKSAGLPVYLGLEMDWIPGKGEVLGDFLAPYDWDIVLGSVHYVGAWGIDDDEFLFEWEKRDVATAWGDYAALMRELAETGLADALTHPDVVKKFGHRPADETPLHAAIVEGATSIIAAGVKRVVYSSSASVYGNALAVPMTEEHPFNNRTTYGATKIAGEHMCRAFHERYGLNYVGLRYMNVYGSRQDYKGTYIAVIMKILDRLDQGLPPIVYGDGSQEFDFIYVSDVARANVKAMQSEATDRFYNVGSGQGTTIKAITEMILDLTGSNLPIQYEPAGQTFVTKRIGDPEQAARDLGFRSSIELRDGLKRLIEWRQNHKEQVDAQRALA